VSQFCELTERRGVSSKSAKRPGNIKSAAIPRIFCVDEMAARQIKRVTGAIDERFSFTRLQGLHDDLLIPRIGISTGPDREKDTLAAGNLGGGKRIRGGKPS